MTFDALWKQAIADAYRIFSSYPAPRNLQAAPKHDVAEVLARLRATSLDNLPADNLGSFAGSALYTIGDLADYKHFLPRMLELSLGHPSWLGLEPPAIARKLIYAAWSDWPEAEQDVIKRIFSAAWNLSHNGDPADYDASNQLCALAWLGDHPEPRLAAWLPLGNAHAVIQVVKLIADLHSGSLAWWDEAPALQAVSAWTVSPAIRQALIGSKNIVPPDDHWQIEEALKYIRRH